LAYTENALLEALFDFLEAQFLFIFLEKVKKNN